VLSFGGRGRATQRIWTRFPQLAKAFVTGPARKATEGADAVDLTLEAMAIHRQNVAPIGRVNQHSGFFSAIRPAMGELETPFEHLPAMQLLTSLVAEVGLCSAAGVSEEDLRAHLHVREDPEGRRRSWTAREEFLGAVEREVLELISRARPR
jgi:hypothetical protein